MLGQAGATDGELVLVNEAHGFSLPSINSLSEMRREYEQSVRDGRGADRHLDARLRGKLPDLTSIFTEDAMTEIGYWDNALLGIILGRFKWNDSRNVYEYCPNGFQPLDVGECYESISRWLSNKTHLKCAFCTIWPAR